LSGTVFSGESMPNLANAIATSQSFKKLVLQNVRFGFVTVIYFPAIF
jgi:hypothetical protein